MPTKILIKILYNYNMSSFYFAESEGTSTTATYLFVDSPFVGSIFCKQEDQSFAIDLWVSGARPKKSPVMLTRLKTTIKCDKNRLEAKLEGLWKRSLKDIAKASLKTEGIKVSVTDFKELPLFDQSQLIQGHLFAHDRNQGFDNIGYSKVAKTASMYLFLQSMGTKQPQKAIAAFEDSEMLGEVKTTAINQRLALAKQSGLL